MNKDELKTIAVIETGGTIAGTGPKGEDANYKAGELPVERILDSIPELSGKVSIKVYSVNHLDSNDISFHDYKVLKKLCERLEKDPEIDGMVITHGTDTMEESSFLLNLVLNVKKPVVMTGAMRPATAISPDGPGNLYQAIQTASSPASSGKGVLVVFGGDIYSGRDIQKQNGARIDAFSTNSFGMLGYTRDADVCIIQSPYRDHTAQSDLTDIELEEMPKVEVFYIHEESDPELLSFMLEKYDGVVMAGTGAGNYPRAIQDLIENYEGECMLVRSSRLPEVLVYPSPVFDPSGKTVPSYRLSPQKARLLLMLALKKYGKDKDKIKKCFERY